MAMSRNHLRRNREISVDHNLCGDQVGKLKKRRWSPEEDRVLVNYVKTDGAKNWKKVASQLERTSKSCRLRWVNQLSPDILDEPFTTMDDDIIIDMVQKMGGKWSIIAQVLQGRTDNQIKNRWHSILKNKHGQKAPQQPSEKKLSQTAEQKLRSNLGQTAEQKLRSNLGHLNGSGPSWLNSISAPLPALMSSSSETVDLVSPPASPVVSLPYSAAVSINTYIPLAVVSPHPAANQIDLLASPSASLVPASTLTWHTSISLCPGLEALDSIYPVLNPGNFTAVMQEIIKGGDEDADSTSRLAGSNQPK